MMYVSLIMIITNEGGRSQEGMFPQCTDVGQSSLPPVTVLSTLRSLGLYLPFSPNNNYNWQNLASHPEKMRRDKWHLWSSPCHLVTLVQTSGLPLPPRENCLDQELSLSFRTAACGGPTTGVPGIGLGCPWNLYPSSQW